MPDSVWLFTAETAGGFYRHPVAILLVEPSLERQWELLREYLDNEINREHYGLLREREKLLRSALDQYAGSGFEVTQYPVLPG